MAPRWRVPLLVLGFLSLVLGVAGGLARLVPGLPAPGGAIALHGALMVSGFFGTLIALERAAALDAPWAYAAPLLSGAGGVLIAAGAAPAGFATLSAAAAALVACTLVPARRQPSLETFTLLAGSAAWLAGNAALALGRVSQGWWIAFFTLTIAAERLELSRYLRRRPSSRLLFAAIAVLVSVAPLDDSLAGLGVALILMAAWLAAFDLARRTIRQTRLPRFAAACLLSGYVWLGLGGLLLASGAGADAALHAIFLGFVFSMVLGHAPVILPAVLRVAFPYRPVLYLPLALLHASVAARVAGGLLSSEALKTWGAWGNAGAMATFIVVAALIVLRSRASRPART